MSKKHHHHNYGYSIAVFCESCGRKHYVSTDSSINNDSIRFCSDCLKEIDAQCTVCNKTYKVVAANAKNYVCPDCSEKPYKLRKEAEDAANNIIAISHNSAVFNYAELGSWFTDSPDILSNMKKIQKGLKYFYGDNDIPDAVKTVLSWGRLCLFEPQVFGEMQKDIRSEMDNGLSEDTSLYWENMRILISNCKIEVVKGKFRDKYFFSEFPIYNSCRNAISQHIDDLYIKFHFNKKEVSNGKQFKQNCKECSPENKKGN